MLAMKVVKSNQILLYCERSANRFPWVIGINVKNNQGIKIDLHLLPQKTGKIGLQFADVVIAVEKSELKMVMQRLGISL